jgi:hypothetical protein
VTVKKTPRLKTLNHTVMSRLGIYQQVSDQEGEVLASTNDMTENKHLEQILVPLDKWVFPGTELTITVKYKGLINEDIGEGLFIWRDGDREK